jgi:galactonate dehydratase
MSTASPYAAPGGLKTPGSDEIVKIETFLLKPRSWFFVRVETKNGIVGWGEARLSGHSDALLGAYNEFRERLIGWDPANIQDIYQQLYRHRFHRGGPVLMSAIAGCVVYSIYLYLPFL